MDFEMSRRKYISKLLYVFMGISTVIGATVCVLSMILFLQEKSFLAIVLFIVGVVLAIIGLGMIISLLLTYRSYHVAERKNKEFMSMCKPIRVKCFGTKERNHRKYGYDWQIVVMHNYEYFYSDWLFGYAIDNEEIANYAIDLYIDGDKYYLDINSLRNEVGFNYQKQ